MSNFPVSVTLNMGDEKATSTTKALMLGTLGQTPDGRRFRYALNAATSIAGGNLIQSAVSVGSSVHTGGLTMSTVGVGTVIATGGSTVSLVMVTTNLSSANMYADGYLHIDTAPGSGVYVIKSHASGGSATAVEFVLYGSDPIRDPFSTVSKFGLRRNPYADVVVAAATPTGPIVGVTPKEIPASHYFWAQVSGFGSLNLDTLTTAPGQNIGFSGSSAGHGFALTSAADSVTYPIVAEAHTAASAADTMHFVKIKIE